jgi:hypothetical protein
MIIDFPDANNETLLDHFYVSLPKVYDRTIVSLAASPRVSEEVKWALNAEMVRRVKMERA